MRPRHRRFTLRLALAAALAAALGAAPPTPAQEPPAAVSAAPAPGTDSPIEIHRAAGPIVVDGDLDDEGWRGASRVDVWYETNPGDNVPPKVANVAYLAYDDAYLYAAFEFADPSPKGIRAFYADRDNVPGYTDYGGVIVDTRRNGTGYMFLANPRGIQYDAITSDASGNEDSSVDFFWDSAGRVTETGWRLEMRIPFSSLRYDASEGLRRSGTSSSTATTPATAATSSSARACRGGATASSATPARWWAWRGCPRATTSSSPPTSAATEQHDARTAWAPRSGAATPAAPRGSTPSGSPTPTPSSTPPSTPTSRRSSPTSPRSPPTSASPSSSPRSARSSSRDSTCSPPRSGPVYTRTVTSPRWGARATGKVGPTGYTVLVAQDRGGGSVILPGSNSSDFVDQDFESTVFVRRVRRDVGRSFASFLATTREIQGGGFNRVFGPDFNWRPSDRHQFVGQLLWAESETPNRPDLTADWDGRRLSGHDAQLLVLPTRTRPTTPSCSYNDVADGFRADNGFVPQVGYRESYLEVGRTIRPEDHWVSRLRTFFDADYSTDRDGALLFRRVSPGFGIDGKWNSFWRAEAFFDEVRERRPGLRKHPAPADLRSAAVAAVLQRLLPGRPRRRGGLRQRPPGHRRHPPAQRRRPPHRPLRPHPQRQPPLARRRRRRGRRGRLFTAQVDAAAGQLHLQQPDVPPPDRPIRRDRSATRRSTPSRSTPRAAASPARPSSPTRSTGRRSPSSASATTAV